MSIDRLQEKIRKLKNPSIINFDILSDRIPPYLLQEEGSLPKAYGRFCIELLDALRVTVPAVRFSFSGMALLGTDGLCTLARVLDYAKGSGYYTFLDVPEALSAQRAAENARLLFQEDTLWVCDGLIVSSYIGSDGLKPYIDGLKASGKDLFVVLRTANRSAAELQDLITGGRLVHQAKADIADRMGKTHIGRCGFSQIAGVAPASSTTVLTTMRSKYKNMFLLLDGFDYPNSNAKNCSFAFDQFGHGAAACAGNSVVGAWVDDDADEDEYVEAAVQAAERMKKNLTRYVTIL